ncbi:MAG: hypothetical protein WA005_06430 [Candidatus Binataceae bacterium]
MRLARQWLAGRDARPRSALASEFILSEAGVGGLARRFPAGYWQGHERARASAGNHAPLIDAARDARAGTPNLSRKQGSDERNDNAGDEHFNYCAQEEQKHAHILLSSILSSKQVAALSFVSRV